MSITEEKLKEMIEPQGDLEKLSTISSDGKTLSTRIPKELVDELKMKKGDKLQWILNKEENAISLSISGGTLTDGS